MNLEGNIRHPAANAQEAAYEGVFPRTPGPRPDSQLSSQPLPDGVRDAQGRLNIPFLMHNARILVREGEFDLADRILDSALRARQQLHLVHLAIAHRWEHAGDAEKALRHLKDALAYEASLQTIRPLVALLVREGRDQEAARLLERGARIPSTTEVERLRLKLAAANCHARAENPDASRKILLELIDAAGSTDATPLDGMPVAWSAGIHLASLELRMGRFEEAHEAVATLRRKFAGSTLSAVTRDGRIWKIEAAIHLARGDKRQAHDAFARALELQIQDPFTLSQLAKLAFELGIHATSARLLAEYAEHCPVNAQLISALAASEVHLGRWNQALAHATQAVSMKPDHDGSRDLVARIHVKLSKSGRTDGSGRYAIAGRSESDAGGVGHALL